MGLFSPHGFSLPPFWLFAVTAITTAVASDELRRPPQAEKSWSADARPPFERLASPGWQMIEDRLGQISLGGTLCRSYKLAENLETKLLGWRFLLEHQIEVDAYARAISVWRIPALQSYVVPEGRGQLIWQPPGSGAVRFDKAKIGRAFSEAGSARWRIRETIAGDYEIRSLDGRGYRYVHGLLVSISHPALGDLRVTTQGGLIRQIRRVGASENGPPLLNAEYDEGGHCRRFQLGSSEPNAFDWDEAGELRVWTRPDGSRVSIEYENNLLSRIAETGKAPERFLWEENSGFGRGDSLWQTPVHLSSDGAHDYTYGIRSKGFIVKISDHATGRQVTTVFNPRQQRVVQYCNGETLIAVLRASSAGMANLARIVTGDGEVLEDYRYDPQGRLVAAKRKGEPEQALSYDQTGRLMGLEELREP